jgi:archaemetzincin
MSSRIGPCFCAAAGLLLAGCARNIAPKPSDFVLTIQPMGSVSKKTLKEVENAVGSTFNCKFRVDPAIPLPTRAWYAPRKRWLADVLVSQRSVSPERRTLFVVSQDISRPAHGYENFGILGVGYANGNALVSTFRMRGDEVLLSKITVHELGHLFGLPHCSNASCVMQDLKGRSATLEHSSSFCPNCRAKIARWLRVRFHRDALPVS